MRAKKWKPRKCVECRKAYVPKRTRQKFCSTKCRYREWSSRFRYVRVPVGPEGTARQGQATSRA